MVDYSRLNERKQEVLDLIEKVKSSLTANGVEENVRVKSALEAIKAAKDKLDLLDIVLGD